MTPSRAPTFMTVSEVAARLNRSTETIRSYETSGRLPALRTARGLRLWNQDEVDRFAKTLPAHKGGPRPTVKPRPPRGGAA